MRMFKMPEIEKPKNNTVLLKKSNTIRIYLIKHSFICVPFEDDNNLKFLCFKHAADLFNIYRVPVNLQTAWFNDSTAFEKAINEVLDLIRLGYDDMEREVDTMPNDTKSRFDLAWNT